MWSERKERAVDSIHERLQVRADIAAVAFLTRFAGGSPPPRLPWTIAGCERHAAPPGAAYSAQPEERRQRPVNALPRQRRLVREAWRHGRRQLERSECKEKLIRRRCGP